MNKEHKVRFQDIVLLVHVQPANGALHSCVFSSVPNSVNTTYTYLYFMYHCSPFFHSSINQKVPHDRTCEWAPQNKNCREYSVGLSKSFFKLDIS